MDTPEDLIKLGSPDPEQTAFIEKMGRPPVPDFSNLDATRAGVAKRYAAMIAGMGPAEPHCTESYVQIPLRDGLTSVAKLWRPSKPRSGGSPLFVLFFGGGFVFGSHDSLTLNARVLCRQYGVTVLAPTYRLGPEHPFPAAPQDAWDSARWAAEHAAELGADIRTGFVLGGVSAGANLASVVATQWLEEEHSPSVTGLWLAVPFFFGDLDQVPADLQHLYISHKQNAHSPILSEEVMTGMRKNYKADPRSPLYSPALRTAAIPKMPPVYFQVCGYDPLRDDAIIYNKMLQAAGRKTLLHMYPGLVHGGWGYFPSLKLSEQARIDFVLGCGWLLGETPREDPQSRAGWESIPPPA